MASEFWMMLLTAALGGMPLPQDAAAQDAASQDAAPQDALRPTCPPMGFDARTGSLNGLRPDTPMAEVKYRIPCYTGESAEGDSFNYGGGVFYGDHHAYHYTYLRFIELREGFVGATNPRMFGRTRAELVEVLGPETPADRPFWGRPADAFYTRDWGCLQIGYGPSGTPHRIRAYGRPCDSLYEPR